MKPLKSPIFKATKYTLMAILLGLLFNIPKIVAQNSVKAKNLDEYLYENWSTEHGLPSNSLTRILLGDDGTLWVASYEGLSHFDGLKFTKYDKKNTPAFKNNEIRDLALGVNGEIWLAGVNSGLMKYSNHRIVSVLSGKDTPVLRVLADSKGGVWVGTKDKGVGYFKDDTIKFVEDIELQTSSIAAITESSRGKIAIATYGKGIYEITNGKSKRLDTHSQNINSLAYLDDVTLLLGCQDGLFLLKEGIRTPYQELADVSVQSVRKGVDGYYYVATTKGIWRGALKEPFEEINWEPLDSYQKNISTENLVDVLIDKDNSCWIASYRSGLHRLYTGLFKNIRSSNTSKTKSGSMITEDKDGGLLLGFDQGTLMKYSKGVVTEIPLKTSLGNERIRGIARDNNNNLWVSSYKGLLLIRPDGSEKLYSEQDGLSDHLCRIVYLDRKGVLWVGTRSGGLVKIIDEKVVRTISTKNGMPSNFVLDIYESTEGELWISTNDGGIAIIKDDRVVSELNIVNGLPSNLVFRVRQDQEGVYWICTNGGLVRKSPEGMFSFATAPHFPAITPYDILEDPQGGVWMPTGKGILYVKKGDLIALSRSKDNNFLYKLYDASDGLFKGECTGGARGLTTTQKMLWFTTVGGFSGISPLTIPINPELPKVYVHYISTGKDTLDLNNKNLVLPYTVEDVKVSFGANHLKRIPKLKFYAKLSPHDQEWLLVEPDKELFFRHIEPGKYTLSIKVCTEMGECSETPFEYSFEIKPHFTGTLWFYLLLGLVCLLLIFLIVRWRFQYIYKRTEQLAKLVKKQTAEIVNQNFELEQQNQQVERMVNNLQAIHELSKKMHASLDLKTIVINVHSELNKLMDASVLGIGIYLEEEDVLYFPTVIENNLDLGNKKIPLNAPYQLAVICYAKQELIFMRDVETEYRAVTGKNVQAVRGDIPRSLIYVPLSTDSKKIGVLTIQSFVKNAFETQDIKLLESVSSILSNALDNASAYDRIEKQKQQILEQNMQLEKRNQDITDSINYAKKIQEAIFPKSGEFRSIFPDSFIFRRPRDIVSGDFFWYATVGNVVLLVVADCTGHGIPGAFMSMMGVTLLDQWVYEKGTTDPAEILTQLHRNIRLILGNNEDTSEDGMDMAILAIHPTEKKIEFAGAKLSLIYFENNVLHEIRGNRLPLGMYALAEDTEVFQKTTLPIDKPISVYLFTDGFTDQFGGREGKKYNKTRFKDLLTGLHTNPFEDQWYELGYVFDSYKGRINIQTDDVLVLGLKIDPESIYYSQPDSTK